MSPIERVLLSLVAPLLLLVALQGVRVGERGVAQPPSLTVEQMLQGEGWVEEQGWRFARQAGNPRIVVVEFPTVAELRLALGRVAGPQADGAHRAGDLLRKLDGLGRAGAGLLPQEKRLQALLQTWPGGASDRVRRPDDDASLALVAITAEQAEHADALAPPGDDAVDAARRRALLLHGLAHAEFATQAARRRQAADFWHGQLDQAERERWHGALRARGEDPADERRTLDEVQALLMHTPDERLFRPGELGLDAAGLDDQRRRFEASGPGSPSAPAAPPPASR